MTRKRAASAQEQIRQHVIAGSVVVAVLTIGVGGWAATAGVSSALIAPGQIVVDSNVKKVQHPTGVREINQMHVPVGRNVRVTLGSEDVIHDYAIPAFRVKMDAVPGKLTTLWFQATVPGTYHLFCMEYCGTKHSGMIGEVIAMTPEDYEAWLAAGGTVATGPVLSPVEAGQQLFNGQFACNTCHKPDASGLGPVLNGVFGSTVTLADGRTVVADDNYLRESIMNPSAKIVRGFPSPSLMPTFQGQATEEQIMSLIAYVKSLKPAADAKPAAH